MENKPDSHRGDELPACATEFIRRVVRRMWWRKKAKQDVQAELTAHFEDAVRPCTTAQEKERKARELIEGFGDAKLLAALCHRAKKRCRPLWRKVLLRSTQGLAATFIYLLLCTAPMSLGRPTIRVNYAEWLSNHWRPSAEDTANAGQFYEEAARAYVDYPQAIAARWATGNAFSRSLVEWFSGYDAEEMKALAQWLQNNRPAFEMLRKGARTSHYWPVYDANRTDLGDPNVIENSMQTLKGYRQVTLAFREQIAYEASQGSVKDALDDCLALRRLGRHLQGKGFLNDQLVGISIESICYSGIFLILHRSAVPEALLRSLQEELERGFDMGRQVMGLDGEKALWYDRIQRTFTDDGQGGGHALSQGFPYAAGDWKDNLVNTFRFRYPDRRQTVVMVDQYFQWVQGRLNMLPGAEPNDPAQASTLSVLLSLVTPAYERVAQISWRLKTHETAVITLLAIQRYFRANGSYPGNLDQLVERGYLKQPPRDPFGQGTLTYRRTDEGFILYSWGTNLRDDGGQLGTGSQGQT